MSKNAATVARIVEHNTGGPNRETIAREHIGTIADSHSQFDGDLDDALAEAMLITTRRSSNTAWRI